MFFGYEFLYRATPMAFAHIHAAASAILCFALEGLFVARNVTPSYSSFQHLLCITSGANLL